MRFTLGFCSLTLAAVLAGAFAPDASAACRFEPKFCNKDTEPNKKILVTCDPKDDFIPGGFVTFGAEVVDLQEKGGTAIADTTVSCSSSGTPLTIAVFKKDGKKIDLGSCKSGSTDKDGNITINANLASAGTQVLTSSALAVARERLDLECGTVLLTEKDITSFEAVLDVAETSDPGVNILTIVSLEETFGQVEVCGTLIGPATLSLDPRFESTADINLEEGTIIGTMYTVVDVEGLGTFESQEYLEGTFDSDAGIVNLGFDGDFEPYGRPDEQDPDREGEPRDQTAELP